MFGNFSDTDVVRENGAKEITAPPRNKKKH
jgi:hypothetical protein